MIRHVHVNECDSTQDLCKEQLNNQNGIEHVLVSCENQTSGRGRGENKWTAMPGTLCFSLSIRPHGVLSYTALEISVLIARYFEEKGKTLKLKWPNDLWDEHFKKCGGILVQGNQNQMIAGVGINIFSHDNTYGGVFESEFDLDKKEWAQDIGNFIIKNRYEDTIVLRRDWLTRCGHLNELVKVTEAGELIEGMFQGLGDHGEAEICSNGQISRIYNGSLRISSQA